MNLILNWLQQYYLYANFKNIVLTKKKLISWLCCFCKEYINREKKNQGNENFAKAKVKKKYLGFLGFINFFQRFIQRFNKIES